jgi:uncharacterized pyridoxamine 5'-phosphate oxidase family protein
MDLKDAIAFATQYPVCFLATADGDQPHVRGWLFWFADPTGFYFQTLAPKDVYQQLVANPKVEVCFYNGGDLATAKTMRVTGAVEFLDDPALRHRLIEQDMPFLAGVGDADDPIHQIFRIAHGQAFIWGMSDILKERELPRAVF